MGFVPPSASLLMQRITKKNRFWIVWNWMRHCPLRMFRISACLISGHTFPAIATAGQT